MSEGGDHVPHEVIQVMDTRDDFQTQVLEYIRDTRNEFRMVNEQISKLADELENVKKRKVNKKVNVNLNYHF